MSRLRAGAAVVEITPGAGLAMGGYGARQGVSIGMHDPLNARVLALADGATAAASGGLRPGRRAGGAGRAAREIIARDARHPAAAASASRRRTPTPAR